jgi:hypothetical protein
VYKIDLRAPRRFLRGRVRSSHQMGQIIDLRAPRRFLRGRVRSSHQMGQIIDLRAITNISTLSLPIAAIGT